MSLATKIHEGLQKHSAKMKSKKADTSNKVVNPSGDVDHFEVHPAEGGHMVETHFKAKEGKHGDYMGRKEPHKAVHKSMASAAKHMRSMCPCGGCTQEGAENETPGKQTQEEYKEDD